MSNPANAAASHACRVHALLAIPALTYAVAYAYLAVYHGTPWLGGVVIHESGALTGWQTTLYASHFLGHVPVHTALALCFAGCWRMTRPRPATPRDGGRVAGAVSFLLAFLAGSFVFSWFYFGAEDTLDYLWQRKQGVHRLEAGGSWNLHLPSTLLLPLAMPAYIWLLRAGCALPRRLSRAGWLLCLTGAVCIVVFTLAGNGGDWRTALAVWNDPRYLGHSIRELATFPLTYFPLAALLLARRETAMNTTGGEEAMPRWILAIFALFLLGTGYQAVTTLQAGVGELAQKPSFAKGGQLGIPYLLASHYFEHVLDTIYFAVVVLILDIAASRKKRDQQSGTADERG